MTAPTEEYKIYNPLILRQNFSSGSFSIGDYEDIDLGSSSNSITTTRESLAEEKPPVQQPIWDAFQQVLAQVPKSVLESLPPDAASEIDHYIYGTPKQKS